VVFKVFGREERREAFQEPDYFGKWGVRKADGS